MRTCTFVSSLFAEHCACLTFHYLTRLSPDQEVDDFTVAQNTPLPECIAGCEGDTVRCPSLTAALRSAPLCFPSEAIASVSACPPSLVQGCDTYAEGFGITILIPKNFRHESFEAEEASKELTIQAARKIKAEDKAKKSAAVKQAGNKQKIKKQAATDKKEVEQKTAADHAAPARGQYAHGP